MNPHIMCFYCNYSGTVIDLVGVPLKKGMLLGVKLFPFFAASSVSRTIPYQAKQYLSGCMVLMSDATSNLKTALSLEEKSPQL